MLRNIHVYAALTTYYNISSGYIGLIIPGALWLIGAVALCFVKQVPVPHMR